MKIFEFISAYCQDMITQFKQNKELIDFGQFPHDEIIIDEMGKSVPVVLVDGMQIPVSDFISMDKQEFLSVWNTAHAEESYDNYVSGLIILEGEDAVHQLRNAMRSEAASLQNDVELYLT